MIIKIGDTVFDDEDVPMMIVLSPQDKENILNMSLECTKYAQFPDDFGSQGDMLEWMGDES